MRGDGQYLLAAPRQRFRAMSDATPPRRPPGRPRTHPRGTERITITLDRDLADGLRGQAASSNNTLSEQCRSCLRAGLRLMQGPA